MTRTVPARRHTTLAATVAAAVLARDGAEVELAFPVEGAALDAAVAAVEQAAIQASCETRRLVGQQAQAFTAAALPL